MPSRALVLIAALFALVLAGCGGGDQLSKDEYIKELNSAGKALNSSFSSLGEGVSDSKDTKALGARFEEAAKILRESSEKIGSIKPPDEAADANKKLADGLSKMADSFEEVGKEATKSGTSATSLLPKVSTLTSSEGIKLVQEAINDLKGKGYAVQSSN
ncbi:MAG: hypothetical protein V9E83_07750 [Baekduia sp.]